MVKNTAKLAGSVKYRKKYLNHVCLINLINFGNFMVNLENENEGGK